MDLQLSQEKAQRDQLENLKQQELQHERDKLQQWQQELQPGSSTAGRHAEQRTDQVQVEGDESDCEDDLLDAAAVAARVIASDSPAQPENDSSQDHPAYHGRGWWPGKAPEEVSSSSSSRRSNGGCSPRQLASVNANSGSHNSSSSTQCDNSSSENSMISISTGSNSDSRSCNKERLLADVAACGVQPSLLSAGASSSIEAAGQHKDTPLLAAISSTTRRPAAAAPKSIAAAATSQQERQQQRLSRPPAPVRSRAAPVAVSFTQLETPHLPAREQREVEIKQIRRQAGQQVRSPHPAWRAWWHSVWHLACSNLTMPQRVLSATLGAALPFC